MKADRRILLAAICLAVVILLSGCITEPPGDLIESFVDDENEQAMASYKSDQFSAELKKIRGMGFRRRLKALEGKAFVAYIYATRGDYVVARVENMDVRLDSGEIGDKVKMKITGGTSTGKTIYGEVLQPMGSANIPAKSGGVRPGQKYQLEIMGVTATGDKYGMIDGVKVYVLGANHIGEKLNTIVIGADTLEFGVPVIYAKRISSK